MILALANHIIPAKSLSSSVKGGSWVPEILCIVLSPPGKTQGSPKQHCLPYLLRAQSKNNSWYLEGAQEMLAGVEQLMLYVAHKKGFFFFFMYGVSAILQIAFT